MRLDKEKVMALTTIGSVGRCKIPQRGNAKLADKNKCANNNKIAASALSMMHSYNDESEGWLIRKQKSLREREQNKKGGTKRELPRGPVAVVVHRMTTSQNVTPLIMHMATPKIISFLYEQKRLC
jgi:hypothetical protein